MNSVKFLHATIAVVFWAVLAIPGGSQSLAATTAQDVNDSSRSSKLSKIQHIVTDLSNVYNAKQFRGDESDQ